MKAQSVNEKVNAGAIAVCPPAAKQTNPTEIERQVLAVSINSSVDDLATALCASDWLLARAKEIDRLIKDIAIAWIEAHGAFDIGPMRYSVGYSLTTKCLDLRRTGQAVLEAAGGDLDVLFSILAAQPYKHGSVRNLLNEATYASLFATERTGKLVKGAPALELKRADTRFIRNARFRQEQGFGPEEAE